MRRAQRWYGFADLGGPSHAWGFGWDHLADGAGLAWSGSCDGIRVIWGMNGACSAPEASSQKWLPARLPRFLARASHTSSLDSRGKEIDATW